MATFILCKFKLKHGTIEIAPDHDTMEHWLVYLCIIVWLFDRKQWIYCRRRPWWWWGWNSFFLYRLLCYISQVARFLISHVQNSDFAIKRGGWLAVDDSWVGCWIKILGGIAVVINIISFKVDLVIQKRQALIDSKETLWGYVIGNYLTNSYSHSFHYRAIPMA